MEQRHVFGVSKNNKIQTLGKWDWTYNITIIIISTIVLELKSVPHLVLIKPRHHSSAEEISAVHFGLVSWRNVAAVTLRLHLQYNYLEWEREQLLACLTLCTLHGILSRRGCDRKGGRTDWEECRSSMESPSSSAVEEEGLGTVPWCCDWIERKMTKNWIEEWTREGEANNDP